MKNMKNWLLILMIVSICQYSYSDNLLSLQANKIADECLYVEIDSNKVQKTIYDDSFFEIDVDDEKVFREVKKNIRLTEFSLKTKNIHDQGNNYYIQFTDIDMTNIFSFVLGEEKEKGKKVFICMATRDPVKKYFGKEYIGLSLNYFQKKYSFTEKTDVLVITDTPEFTKLEIYFEKGVSVKVRYRFTEYSG